jgi:hypothetical protein
LANKSSINHLLVFSGFWDKGGIKMEGLTQMLTKLTGTLIGLWRTSDVLLIFMVFFPNFFLPPNSAS